MLRYSHIQHFILKNKYLLVIIFLALLTRLFFIGSSLWHNDAVDFVKSGINLATTGEYLPAHAPDYPAWNVMLAGGQFIDKLLTGEFHPVSTSNLITAFLGILTIILFFFWVKNLSGKNQKIALIASLLLIFLPTFWLFNEFALSETLAVFSVILALFLFDKFLKNGYYHIIILTGLSLALAGLTRITNLLFIGFLPVFAWIYYNRTQQKIDLKKVLIIIIFIVLLPLLINGVAYGLIHDWQFERLTQISRRVTPSISDLFNTAKNYWLYTLPIFLLFSIYGFIVIVFKKQWYLFSILVLPIVSFFYYYAGWWQNGYFDIDRYLIIIQPFVIILTALGIYYFLNWLKSLKPNTSKILFYFFVFVTVGHLIFISLNLFDFKLCETLKDKNFFGWFFPSTYCQINNNHNSEDFKMKLYQSIDRILPDDAVIFVGPDDWAYPQFFGNQYGLGQKKYYKLKPDNTESFNLITEILKTNSPVYLPHTVPALKLFELLEQSNWTLEVLQPSTKIMILKISL